jgi:hypothetical protein
MDGKKVDSQEKSSPDGDVLAGETTMLSKDEQHLAKLGYKQGLLTKVAREYDENIGTYLLRKSLPEFFRHLGLFESWAATYITMNFVSGLPVLFGFAMYTGGPKAAFANWTMVGGYVLIVEISPWL